MVREDQNMSVIPAKAGIQSEPAATHSPFVNLKDLLKLKSRPYISAHCDGRANIRYPGRWGLPNWGNLYRKYR